MSTHCILNPKTVREARYMRKRTIRMCWHLSRTDPDAKGRTDALVLGSILDAIRCDSRSTGEHKQIRFDHELKRLPASTNSLLQA